MTSTSRPVLRVGMVGYAFMGAMHSHAWRTAPHFFDLPLRPELAVLSGRDDVALRAAAATMGWRDTETDWRAVLERDDVDLIDICTPGNTHADIAVAALEAGKHVLCEKPLANSVEEAERMTAAAEAAEARGVFAMCGFSYRRTPALTLARRLVEQGRIGTVRHVRGQYLQDWLSDATSPMTWRLDREKSGSGALGDIGAHSIDAAQYVTGLKITGVSGMLNTFVTERPLSGARSGLGGSGSADAGMGQVTVDDAAIFSARFDGGAIGAFEATRFALGRKNSMRLEVNGTLGSLAFDFEHMNSLEFYDGTQPQEIAGFSTIDVTEPVHPYTGNWWPAGHGLGYEHGFTHQVVDLVQAIADGRTPSPSFADALQVQKVLRAVEQSSAQDAGWQHV
ncbi:dehydrogenase [Arthrobacter sp. RIT-PI-e]|uniref:Gfo/Idh/MocA family protein n=1 Tax=Arthrobacter sp. RIT-PI-e TaxID=1681197 RepID=UPI0006760C35|nr:Gfo/Idh/MocA family oxidoreductase [Arthrobacter sp. RIT-PI-e]KNC17871.1 dehydrogenase [Arthrobacter sp. RIT-PI-e]